MRELNFEVGEERRIKINGEEYPILKTDAEVCGILDKLANIQNGITQEAKKITTLKTAETLLKNMSGFSESIDKAVDDMIGKGAAKKIFAVGGKKTVTVDEKIQITSVIAAGIVAEFKESARSKFALEED